MRCLLYYITDRTEFPGEDDTQRRCLLEKIAEAVRCGVNFIQLREKDLPTRELEFLAREALRVARSQPETGNQKRETRILINSRTDIAIAVGADGVHLPAHDMAPQEARTIWSKCSAGALSPAIVSVSCHSEEDVRKPTCRSSPPYSKRRTLRTCHRPASKPCAGPVSTEFQCSLSEA